MTTELRKEIDYSQTPMEVMFQMGENDVRENTFLMTLSIQHPEYVATTLSALDDMNIRGIQIHLAFQEYCDGNISKLIKCIADRDIEMVDIVNEMSRSEECHHKVVAEGARNNRELLI